MSVYPDPMTNIDVPITTALPALELQLTIRDPELVAALLRHSEGDARDEFAMAALRIGVQAIERASGMVDAAALQREGERMISEVDALVRSTTSELSSKVGNSLREYFDPQSGKLVDRLDRLVRKDGELANLLSSHLDGDGCKLSQTLARHVGEHSPLLQMLSPNQKDGVLAKLAACIETALAEQRGHILKEFDLNQEQSALKRLVNELTGSNGKLRDEFTKDLKQVSNEFDLNNSDGALSRLVGSVEKAQRAISSEFDSNNDASALSRLSKLVKTQIDDLARQQTEFQLEVREKLGIEAGKAEEAVKGTQHGVEFEDLVGEILQVEANSLNDVFEPTGRAGGHLGAREKVGDHVIRLGKESRSPGEHIVFECKEDASFTVSKALAELERAKKNRAAQIGVYVFSRRTAPAGQPAFMRQGDDVLIVWDRDDQSSDVLVRAAYSVARALVVRRTVADQSAAAEWRVVDQSLVEIEKLSKEAAEIKKCATTVKNHGETIGAAAQKILDTLASKIEAMRTHINQLRANQSSPEA